MESISETSNSLSGFIKNMVQSEMNECLFRFVLNNITAGVRWTVLLGADVNATDDSGCTPLHRAALFGNIDIAKLLIQNGANVNAKNNHDETPLHRAALNGNIEIATLLIEKGANVNAENNHNGTPLHDTALLGNIDIAKLLIDHGGETIGITVRDPDINNLIQGHATELRTDLRALRDLPDDIFALNDTQKALLVKLTAPYKAGNPLVAREDLGNKSLIDYMREDKPQLMIFAKGYHGDTFLGGIKNKLSDTEQLNILNTLVRSNPLSFKDNYRMGVELKQQHTATATKIPG